MASCDGGSCGWIPSNDDNDMSNEQAMEIIGELVGEIGYDPKKETKRRKKGCGSENHAVSMTNRRHAGPNAVKRGIHDVQRRKGRESALKLCSNINLVPVVSNIPIVTENMEDGQRHHNAGVRSVKQEITDMNTTEMRDLEVAEASGSKPCKKRRRKAVKNSKVGTDITVDCSTGAQKFIWKSHVTNAKSTHHNVMHFPREIAKRCLRVFQKEINLLDVKTKNIVTCRVHKAIRNNEPQQYEKYMALGWYEFAKSLKLRNGDTVVWSMLRFSPYIYVNVERC